jgi:hypothetical protein
MIRAERQRDQRAIEAGLMREDANEIAKRRNAAPFDPLEVVPDEAVPEIGSVDRAERDGESEQGESKRHSGRVLHGHRCVDADPQVHRVQLLAAAGFQVEEQLRAVRDALPQHLVDDERAGRDRTPVEAGDFGAEHVV